LVVATKCEIGNGSAYMAAIYCQEVIAMWIIGKDAAFAHMTYIKVSSFIERHAVGAADARR
jgi:hypothetical protein